MGKYGQNSVFYVDIMANQPGVSHSNNLCVIHYPNEEIERILVDCGLSQEEGNNDYYNHNFSFKPENLNYVLLTHCHLDHSGKLPLLIKKGYRGNIYMTNATSVLLKPALKNSYQNNKSTAIKRKTSSLYSKYDLDETLQKRITSCCYDKTIQLGKYVQAYFIKNGHMLGAAMIFLKISYPEQEDINLLFTGDYCDENVFFEVTAIPKAIRKKRLTLITEATYGDTSSDTIQKGLFEESLVNTLTKKGTAIICGFAIERVQEILYRLKQMQDVAVLPKEIPIYLDGNLAIVNTLIFLQNGLGIKKEMLNYLPENFMFVDNNNRDTILQDKNVKIVVTTSGMGSHGNAPIYIEHFLPVENNLILFTGYVAKGTLGYQLKNIPKGCSLFVGKEKVKRVAEVVYANEFSKHAKGDTLIALEKNLPNVVLVLITHGSKNAKEVFLEKVRKEIHPNNVGILGDKYFYRIGATGLIKTMKSKL